MKTDLEKVHMWTNWMQFYFNPAYIYKTKENFQLLQAKKYSTFNL